MTYFVEIVHSLTDTLEKRLPYSSERMAEKGECGVNRNLDHEKYHTQITSEDVPLEDEVG